MNRITVVIPCKERDGIIDPATTTLESLKKMDFKDFKVVVVPDQGKGANWARNEGFKQCDTEFVLFSDNDIEWKPDAFDNFLYTLKMFPKASYSYGRYKLYSGTDFTTWGHYFFDPARLWAMNYISTMSLIRAKDFPGFDESIKRFQDWDLWLTMLRQGKRGAYCNDLIFTTKLRQGISNGGELTLDEGAFAIDQKHGLELDRFKGGYL